MARTKQTARRSVLNVSARSIVDSEGDIFAVASSKSVKAHWNNMVNELDEPTEATRRFIRNVPRENDDHPFDRLATDIARELDVTIDNVAYETRQSNNVVQLSERSIDIYVPLTLEPFSMAWKMTLPGITHGYHHCNSAHPGSGVCFIALSRSGSGESEDARDLEINAEHSYGMTLVPMLHIAGHMNTNAPVASPAKRKRAGKSGESIAKRLRSH